MIPVKSSLIKAVFYDEERETLQIEFKKGGKYEYAMVTPEMWRDFQSAESIGAYFCANIKGIKPSKPLPC
jgi:hypothetical protein